MAFPGTPVQELFPIRRPPNGPPGLRARHVDSIADKDMQTAMRAKPDQGMSDHDAG